jgi:GT2 family glycosyltransferase
MKLVALTTSHNRRDLTLRALRSLYEQKLPTNCDVEVCLVDDGSNDGTVSAIRANYPNVKILEGNGHLFWAGGMRLGWDSWVAHRDPDALLVFNDDANLYPTAIEDLLAASRLLREAGRDAHAIAGALVDPRSKQTSYGGQVRASAWHSLLFRVLEPTGQIENCDTLNMNCVLISREALSRVGFLDNAFAHHRADFDFGLRLKAAGGDVVLAPSYVGEDSRNPPVFGMSIMERWRKLISPKGEPFRERLTFCRRHGGWFWFLFWISPYLTVWFKKKL